MLETETITASVLRYKLQYFPSDIKSEIQGMIQLVTFTHHKLDVIEISVTPKQQQQQQQQQLLTEISYPKMHGRLSLVW